MKLFFTSLIPQPVSTPTLKKFRYGFDYAISNCTDTYGVNHENMEFLTMKYGFRSTVFESTSFSTVNRDEYTQNVFECCIYWNATFYADDGYKSIPDYASAVWTSAGVAAFTNAVLGVSKPKNYPLKGTQMMYISDGRLGIQLDVPYTDWDKGIGYEGINNPDVDPESSDTAEITATGTDGDSFDTNYAGLSDTSPQGYKAFSYGQGMEDTWQLRALYQLAGRNSESSVVSTGEWFDEWSINKRSEISYPSTSRITDTDIDPVYTIQENIDNVETNLNTKTIPDQGWYRNFTHWHSASMSDMETFLIMIKSVVDANPSCWVAGMGEAVEYRWFRNMITGIEITNGSSDVTVNVTIENALDIPLDNIITPISIELNLIGTSLESKDITSDNGRVRSMGNNIFIIDVFVDSLETILTEDLTPDYYNFDDPVIIGNVYGSGTLTIDTDVLTVATLFIDTVGTVVERKLSDATQHVFTSLSGSTTYYLALMTRETKSIIETINT